MSAGVRPTLQVRRLGAYVRDIRVSRRPARAARSNTQTLLMQTETDSRPPAVGAPAPDFTLGSTGGGTVTLSEFRGKQHVLIAFFPLAFTSTCTSEMCAFSDDFDSFLGHGVQVLPVSVDAVPSLKEFRNKHGMKVELLSDFRREASRAYGVLREDAFCSQRAYFLVDRDGIVRWAHVEDNPGRRRENREILDVIEREIGAEVGASGDHG